MESGGDRYISESFLEQGKASIRNSSGNEGKTKSIFEKTQEGAGRGEHERENQQVPDPRPIS